MSSLFKSKNKLNEKKEIKKKREISKGLSSDELVQFQETNDIIQYRNKDSPLKIKEKKERDIYNLEENMENMFNKIDTNLEKIGGNIKEIKNIFDEIKGYIYNLLIIYIFNENLFEEKDKPIIKNYLSNLYKKLFPDLLKKIHINTKAKNSTNISDNNNNIKIHQIKNTSLGKNNTNNKTLNNKRIPQRENDYKINPFINSFENSINQSIKSNNKSNNIINDKKGNNNKKNIENIIINPLSGINRKKKIRKALNNNTQNNYRISINERIFEIKKFQLDKSKKMVNIKKSNKKNESNKNFIFESIDNMNNEFLRRDKMKELNPFLGPYLKDSNSNVSKKNK